MTSITVRHKACAEGERSKVMYRVVVTHTLDAAGWVRHVVLAAISFLKTHLPFLRPILASAGAIV